MGRASGRAAGPVGTADALLPEICEKAEQVRIAPQLVGTAHFGEALGKMSEEAADRVFIVLDRGRAQGGGQQAYAIFQSPGERGRRFHGRGGPSRRAK